MSRHSPKEIDRCKRIASKMAVKGQSVVCVRYGCWRTPLKHMRSGESHQTSNGFFTIQISGLYCPRCGAGYGG